MDPLPPQTLVERIDLVLTAAARYMRQFPPAAMHEEFRDRKRTPAGTAFHVFRLSEMGLQATQQTLLQFEGFNEVPPADWTADQIAAWGLSVRDRIRTWWAGETNRALDYLVPTYYGQRSCHDVIERTAWHAAQHTRQLMLMLESYGIAPDGPLTADDLAGLPVPDEVWG
jgi:hypothetical protein